MQRWLRINASAAAPLSAAPAHWFEKCTFVFSPGNGPALLSCCFYPKTWASVSGAQRGGLDPLEFWNVVFSYIEFLVGKCFSLSFELVKWNFPTAAPPGKKSLDHPLEKSPISPALEEIPPTLIARSRHKAQSLSMGNMLFTLTRTASHSRPGSKPNSDFNREDSKSHFELRLNESVQTRWRPSNRTVLSCGGLR